MSYELSNPPPIEKRSALDRLGKPVEGEITQRQAACVGCFAGKIKLLNGIEGRTSGFGLAHIEANEARMKQLNGLNFNSVHKYVRYIIENVSFIGKQDDGRIVLILEENGIFHHVICQWDVELNFWSVTTAIPKRNMRDTMVLWKRQRDESEPHH